MASGFFNVGSGLLTINFSCIPTPPGPGSGDGNIHADPLFVDTHGPDDVIGTQDDDLHLTAGSPGINTGSNYAPDLPAEDLERNPRIRQCRVDMRACESPYPSSLFDACNSNGSDDTCDVYDAVSADCNENHVPDECDLVDGNSVDCNTNGWPDECEPPALLTAAVPADQSSFWRSANNVIRLTFGADITVPEPGQVRIQEMLPDGAFGPDMSANGFTFTVEDVVEGAWESFGGQGDAIVSFVSPAADALVQPASAPTGAADSSPGRQPWVESPSDSLSPERATDSSPGRQPWVTEALGNSSPGGATEVIPHPRILKIQENGPVLTHRTWIAVRNLGGIGGWTGVGPFEVQYVVQVGDVNNDGKVLANDLSAVFPKIPTNPAGDQERADVNGDGKVLANDLSAVFPRIPSPPVPKPSGH
jgi:hypothetical protein